MHGLMPRNSMIVGLLPSSEQTNLILVNSWMGWWLRSFKITTELFRGTWQGRTRDDEEKKGDGEEWRAMETLKKMAMADRHPWSISRNSKAPIPGWCPQTMGFSNQDSLSVCYHPHLGVHQASLSSWLTLSLRLWNRGHTSDTSRCPSLASPSSCRAN